MNKNNLKSLRHSIPAAERWFTYEPSSHGDQLLTAEEQLLLSHEYLSPFGDTILPYELITPSIDPKLNHDNLPLGDSNRENHELASILAQFLEHSNGTTFHRFHAPLSLFLLACKPPPSQRLTQLYIAQAQLVDLPKALRDDLPTPRLVLEAGKGDIYDSNLWMGIPPTYTPLHKDPNPNLFVQLASTKRVRLFEPGVGAEIFRGVQTSIRRPGVEGRFRGDEMMEGLEREVLHEAVWGDAVRGEGLEAMVGPGDALFIPKGWWHSIRSVGDDVTASVNWWYR